jgi:hypothetical protein
MRHRSYPEFHIPATVVPDKDTQEFLDAVGSVARFPSSPPPSLAIGAYPGAIPGANLSEGLVPGLWLAEDSEPLDRPEHLRRAMQVSHRLYREGKRDQYASSEFFFLALAKSHPDLQNASPSEALMMISLGLDLLPDEIGLCESRTRDIGYLDFPALLQSYWSEIQPAYLYPDPDWNRRGGDLFHQALAMCRRQPVCSSDCPEGNDRYHQLLSLAYWHHALNGGRPFGLEQALLGKVLNCSQMNISKLLRRAIQEGHLTRADSRTPYEAKLSGKTFEYLWTTGGVLPNRAITSRRERAVRSVGPLEVSRKREERAGNRPAASGMSDAEFLQRFERRRSRGKKQWRTRCPSHDDEHPSLDILITEEVRCLNCWAGCATEDVMKAAGLEWRDMFK